MNVDSAEVIHGLFQMQGEIDTTMIASLYMDDQSIMPLVMEKGNIDIRIENARIHVSGTPLNEKLYEFVGKKNAIEELSVAPSSLSVGLFWILNSYPLINLFACIGENSATLS